MFKYRSATVAGVAAVAAMLSLTAQATEEVTVDGTAIALAAAARKAELHADMAAYGQALRSEFTAEVEAELRSGAAPRLRVASASRANRRG